MIKWVSLGEGIFKSSDYLNHHYSIDVNGNFHDWGDHPNRRGDK